MIGGGIDDRQRHVYLDWGMGKSEMAFGKTYDCQPDAMQAASAGEELIRLPQREGRSLLVSAIVSCRTYNHSKIYSLWLLRSRRHDGQSTKRRLLIVLVFNWKCDEMLVKGVSYRDVSSVF